VAIRALLRLKFKLIMMLNFRNMISLKIYK